jgi:hypothetical protein
MRHGAQLPYALCIGIPAFRKLLVDRHGEEKVSQLERDMRITNAVFYPNLILRVIGNLHIRAVKRPPGSATGTSPKMPKLTSPVRPLTDAAALRYDCRKSTIPTKPVREAQWAIC